MLGGNFSPYLTVHPRHLTSRRRPRAGRDERKTPGDLFQWLEAERTWDKETSRSLLLKVQDFYLQPNQILWKSPKTSYFQKPQERPGTTHQTIALPTTHFCQNMGKPLEKRSKKKKSKTSQATLRWTKLLTKTNQTLQSLLGRS